MQQYLIDVKALFAVGIFGLVSFSECEIIMKIIVFSLTVGYMIRRWYLLEKNNKNGQNYN